MEPDEASDTREERNSLLKGLVLEALDIVISSPDVSIGTAQAIADKIGDSAGKLDVDHIAEIVKSALEATGEGLGDATETAGGVAGAIVEGLSNVDLSV